MFAVVTSQQKPIGKELIVLSDWEHRCFSMKVFVGSIGVTSSSYEKCGVLFGLHSAPMYIQKKRVPDWGIIFVEFAANCLIASCPFPRLFWARTHINLLR